MKRLFFAGLVFAAVTGSGLAADENFSQSLTREELSAAGLDRLSPAELSRLDALIAAYKNGDLVAARRSAEAALLAKQQAEAEARAALLAKQVAEADAKAARSAKKAAEVEAASAKAEASEAKKTDAGFLAKAKVLLVPGTKIEYAVIKSTIPGKFRGWEGRAVIALANGQNWQVTNGGSYFTPAVENAEVEISKSSLGGYWMNIPAADIRIRVNLLSDGSQK